MTTSRLNLSGATTLRKANSQVVGGNKEEFKKIPLDRAFGPFGIQCVGYTHCTSLGLVGELRKRELLSFFNNHPLQPKVQEKAIAFYRALNRRDYKAVNKTWLTMFYKNTVFRKTVSNKFTINGVPFVYTRYNRLYKGLLPNCYFVQTHKANYGHRLYLGPKAQVIISERFPDPGIFLIHQDIEGSKRIPFWKLLEVSPGCEKSDMFTLW